MLQNSNHKAKQPSNEDDDEVIDYIEKEEEISTGEDFEALTNNRVIDYEEIMRIAKSLLNQPIPLDNTLLSDQRKLLRMTRNIITTLQTNPPPLFPTTLNADLTNIIERLTTAENQLEEAATTRLQQFAQADAYVEGAHMIINQANNSSNNNATGHIQNLVQSEYDYDGKKSPSIVD